MADPETPQPQICARLGCDEMVFPREDGAELPLYHSKECRTLARRMRRASGQQQPNATVSPSQGMSASTISAELHTVADELHTVAGELHTVADGLDDAEGKPSHAGVTAVPPPRPEHAPPATRSRRNRRLAATLAAIGVGVGATAAVTAILVSLTHGSPSRVAATPGRQPSARFALETGPGCPAASNASVSPYDSSPAHRWLSGGTGCLSAYLYTQPTTAADPTAWQNDLDWWFSGVPKATACTIGVYIPPVQRAAGTALYFWTTGSQNYSSNTRFTVDQAANRGRWVTIGPFRFPTGRAHVEITDTRVTNSDATLVASTVRLLC